jgi:hypothetical protein
MICESYGEAVRSSIDWFWAKKRSEKRTVLSHYNNEMESKKKKRNVKKQEYKNRDSEKSEIDFWVYWCD